MGKIGVGHADIKAVAENWPSENVQKLNRVRTNTTQADLASRSLFLKSCVL